MSLLWWCQNLLQELLDLVNVCLHLTVIGQERRVSAWSQIVQISWFPEQKKEKNYIFYEFLNFISITQLALALQKNVDNRFFLD